MYVFVGWNLESLATIKQTESHLAPQVWWYKSSRAVNRPQDVFEMRQHGRRGLLKKLDLRLNLVGINVFWIDWSYLGDGHLTIQPEVHAFTFYCTITSSTHQKLNVPCQEPEFQEWFPLTCRFFLRTKFDVSSIRSGRLIRRFPIFRLGRCCSGPRDLLLRNREVPFHPANAGCLYQAERAMLVVYDTNLGTYIVLVQKYIRYIAWIMIQKTKLLYP